MLMTLEHGHDLPAGPARVPDRLHRAQQPAHRRALRRLQFRMTLMRVAIRHTTHYRYDALGSFAVQRLRLTPVRQPGAERPLLERSRRTASRTPPSYVDGFGNRVHLITHCKPYEELTITASGEVETFDTGGVVGDLGETANPHVFLRPTPLTQSSAADRRAEPTGCRAPGCSTGCTICWRRSPVASPTSPMRRTRRPAPPRRSRRGRGVCQDHAHIFIAAARRLGSSGPLRDRLPASRGEERGRR